MKCPECQFENREEAIFCRSCGTSLETDISCPNCESSNPPDSKFCEKCGQDLQPSKETPSIDYSEPQSYTPKHLTDKILTNRSSIEGERKLVTVFFADVANYTAMAEKLDPEEVHQVMDGCFKILMDEIHKYEGTINQFTGDGVMALFGAPVAHEDHAQRACQAALAIQKTVRRYGEKIEKDSNIEFKLRIGLNSGPVIVGSIGDDLRMDYTAVGDTTNLAARMESKAGPGNILVSSNTYKAAKDYFDFKAKSKLEIKGKEQPQKAYELIKVGEVLTRIKASQAKGFTKFVGRKNSMFALEESYQKVRTGAGQLIGIVGEAGVGKSRLLYEFAVQLSQGEVTYLESRCLHYGGSIIYMPILEILRNYFGIKEDDREFIINKKLKEKISGLDEKLSDAIPSFQDLLSAKVEDKAYTKLEPKQKREKIFESLRDLFLRESQNKPVVLVLDDLHWIDKTSEEFLDYLIGWLINTRIMLIFLYRPEYTHQWGSKSYYTKIGLDQLGTASSGELVQAILEEGEVVPELKQLILNRAAGNPLFMEEFTHSLIENGTIQKKDRQFVLSKKTADIPVPDSIQAIIAARIDRLEDNLKRTMQVASVIGREFAFRILQTITGMREEIKSYLLNLQGLELIYEKSLFPELEYIFKHALTQEVAYNSLLLARRKEIHEKIGQAVEELYPHRLEEFCEILAYHYCKSDNLKSAYQYLKLSGKKASGRYSFREAFVFLKDAIHILSRLPDTLENKREQIQVHLLIASTANVLTFPEGSLNTIKKGEKIAKELGDKRSLAQFYFRIGQYYFTKADADSAMKYQEKYFEEAVKIQDIDGIAPVAIGLCFAYMRAGECFKIIHVASKVLPLFESTKKESDFFGLMGSPYAMICGYYGYSQGMLGNFEEGINLFEKARAFSRGIDDLIGLAVIEVHYGLMLLAKGEGQNAIEHFQNSFKYCEETKLEMLVGVLWFCLGGGYYLLGEMEVAQNHLEKGLKIYMDSDRQDNLATIYNYLSLVKIDFNQLGEAQTYVERALELAKANSEKSNEAWSRIIWGILMSRKDPTLHSEAEDSILLGIETMKKLKLKPAYAKHYLDLGEFYADCGQKKKALNILKKAESMFKEMGMDYYLEKTQVVFGRL